MRLAFDVFPAADPKNGARLVRLTAGDQLQAGPGLRVERFGLGSGIVVINKNHPDVTAANFAAGNYVRVYDLDISSVTALFGFFFDERFFKVLSVDEGGGQVQRYGGPGVMAYLGRVILDNVNYVSFGDPTFGPRADGYWWWYQDQYGDILKRLIDEAQDPDRPDYASLIPAVTYDFTSSLDSAGVAWATFSGSYSLPIGLNYLDILQRLIDAGLFIRMSPEFLLQAFQSDPAVDRSSATFADGKIRFVSAAVAGANANLVGDLDRTSRPSLPTTRALVRGDSADPATMIHRTLAGSIKREVFVTVEAGHAADVLNAAGDRALGIRADAGDTPVFRHRLGGDYLTGLYSPFPPVDVTHPIVAATADGGGTSSDTYVVPLPSGIQSGHLLVCFFGSENGGAAVTFPAGWTELLDGPTSGGDERFAVAYRFADGTEGASINVTMGGADGQWYSHVMRITSVDAAKPPELASFSDISSAADAPSLTPTGGAQDVLWIASAVKRDIGSPPASYSQTIHATYNGWEMAVAWRQLTAASENPGPWSASGTSGQLAATISVRPGVPSLGFTYWVGDLVTIATGTGVGDYNEVNQRVYAINWVLDSGGVWWPVPELGPQTVDDSRPLGSLGAPGAGGGGAAGTTTSEPPPTLKRLTTNKSGVTVDHGDVVVFDSANDVAFITTALAAETRLIGIAQESIPNNAQGYVATHGYIELVNVVASVTRGHFGFTSTTAKKASGAAARTAGAFCQFLKGGTTPSAVLFGPPDPVIDHGALIGLGDDDHTQYATNAEFDDHNVRHEPGGADPMAVDAAAATGSLRTLGTGAAQAAGGTHSHPSGIASWKEYVRAATTVAGTLATSFENGDTIDGVVLATGDRILVKNQAAGAENGIYVIAASGAPTRATDFDVGSEAVGAAVVVTEGTDNGDRIFICTTNAPITIGTTALVFAIPPAPPPSGTSFPASPATNDLRYRTDLFSSYYWDGFRWNQVRIIEDPVPTAGDAFVQPYVGSAVAGRLVNPAAGGVRHADVNMQSLDIAFQVASGGTALGASHYWTINLVNSNTGGIIVGITINSGASGTWRNAQSVNIAALLGTACEQLEVQAIKTGTPGNLYLTSRFRYFLVDT